MVKTLIRLGLYSWSKQTNDSDFRFVWLLQDVEFAALPPVGALFDSRQITAVEVFPKGFRFWPGSDEYDALVTIDPHYLGGFDKREEAVDACLLAAMQFRGYRKQTPPDEYHSDGEPLPGHGWNDLFPQLHRAQHVDFESLRSNRIAEPWESDV